MIENVLNAMICSIVVCKFTLFFCICIFFKQFLIDAMQYHSQELHHLQMNINKILVNDGVEYEHMFTDKTSLGGKSFFG
jgi:hypothetical protein